jgi:hypothetical protein
MTETEIKFERFAAGDPVDENFRISGKVATNVALEANERRPINLASAPETSISPHTSASPHANLPADQPSAKRRRHPPRVHKPSPGNDRCLAPTPDLEHHRRGLREAFGNTMSDEFVEVMLGKLTEALRPSPHDELDERTLNAGLAVVASMKPQSELEALLAVQIVATGFSGQRFLRQSHHIMNKNFIDVYGGYAIKLLRLQTELIQAFDRHRRGNRQTVEVRHVHIYPGAKGAVGIFNEASNRVEGEE